MQSKNMRKALTSHCIIFVYMILEICVNPKKKKKNSHGQPGWEVILGENRRMYMYG